MVKCQCNMQSDDNAPLYRGLRGQIIVIIIVMTIGIFCPGYFSSMIKNAYCQHPAGAKAYVGLYKDNAVAVFDTSTNQVLTTILVPAGPHGMLPSPDGRRLYVTSDGASVVSIIDTATDKVIGAIEVGQSPHGLALTPDGKSLLVAVNGASQVCKIDTASGKVVGNVPVPMPHTIALMPDGRTAYVAAQEEGKTALVELDIRHMKITHTIPQNKAPRDVQISADGKRLDFTLAGVNALQVFNPANNRLVAQIPVDASPHQPLLIQQGKSELLVVQGPGELAIINPNDNTLITTVAVGKFPHWVAVNPNGHFAYVTNEGSNDLSIVDLVARRVIDTIPIGNAPRKIVVIPNVKDPPVSIAGFAYVPASLSITPGATVVWSNDDAVPHTVTADDNSWDSGNIDPGMTYEHTFAKAGIYPYHCAIHPHMRGKIIVTDAIPLPPDHIPAPE